MRAHMRAGNQEGEKFMILDERALKWTGEVRSRALNAGWNVYEQSLRNQRQHDPSLVMVRADRVILAYLRTGRPRPVPPVDRFAGLPGVETYVWRPADLPFVAVTLTSKTPP